MIKLKIRLNKKIIVPNVNIFTYFITEDTENTEELRPYFIYSVFSVVNLSLEIGEKILVLDYRLN